MWIVILNFSIFVLLLGFFFYGLTKWKALINEPDEDCIVDTFYQRLTLWILIIGLAAFSLCDDLVIWLLQNY